MPYAYDPIIRHEWQPTVYVCPGCRAQLLTETCGIAECRCSCNAPAVLHIPRVETDDDFEEFGSAYVRPSRGMVTSTEEMDLQRDLIDDQQRDDVLHMDETIEMEWHGGKATPVLAGIAVGAGAVGFGESGFALPAALLILGITLIIIGIRLRSSRA